MKYKLIKPINQNYSPVEQILTNRGIPFNEISHYINTTDNDINPPEALGEDKLKALFPDNKQGNYLADKLQKFTKLFWKEVEIVNKDWHRAVKGFRGEESIPIMTIHKSKGLEYDSVYFMGLEDSAFWNFKKQPEEDRCVFFVALSRAKRKITFTYCEYRYNFNYSKQKRSTINEFYELLKKPGMANLISAVDNMK